MKNKKIYWSLSVLVMIVIFAMIAIHYEDLPEQVAMHFNLSGQANRYGHRYELFFLPAVSACMLSIFYWIDKKNLKINPYRFGVKNKSELKITRLFTAQMALFSTLFIAYATWAIMAVSTRKQEKLGTEFLWILGIGFLLLLGNYMWSIARLKE